MQYLASLDMNQNQILNMLVQNLATAPASPKAGQIYFNTSSNALSLYTGTAWVAFGDMLKSVYDTNGDGIVDVAAKLQTARIISATGDATGSAPAFDGSAAVAIPLTLAPSGVTAGTYTKVTVDAKGRVTVGATLLASDIPSLTHSAISDFDTEVRTSRLDQMASPVASVSMGGNTVTNVATPVNPTDAATKAYVDAASSGLDPKMSVRVATTGSNITLSALQTIDGVPLAQGDRVLVKDQTSASANGIYIVSTGAWTRSTDANSSTNIVAGLYTFVNLGALNGESGWVLAMDPDTVIVVGTTSLLFTQFSGAGEIIAGAGLNKTGNTLSMASGIVTPGTYTKVTTDTFGRVTAGAALTPTDISSALGYQPPKTYSGLIGDGVSTSISITPSMTSNYPVVIVWNVNTSAVVMCDITMSGATITLTFAVAPAVNSLRVTCVG